MVGRVEKWEEYTVRVTTMTEIDPLLQAKDADGVHDGDTVMRQYPSPVPNGQDTASFFDENGDSNNDTSIPNDAAPHPEQQLDQEHHQQQPGEQPSSNEHDGQTQPQDHQEHDPIQPPSARQTMTSAEELQLAAQLSQDISQSMPSALLEASSADVDVDDSSLRAEIQESNEPINLDIQQHQDNPLQEEHMQDHEHHLPPQEHDQPLPPQDQHLQHHDQAMHNHDQSVPQLHDGLSHHTQPPQHQFMPAPPQQHPHHQQLLQHIQPHGPLGHPMQHYGPPIIDNTPPRKRSKVSRACDECRRKKVKCDASSENGEELCSNCRRSNMNCLFSRVPQKRGPSKGYACPYHTCLSLES